MESNPRILVTASGEVSALRNAGSFPQTQLRARRESCPHERESHQHGHVALISKIRKLIQARLLFPLCSDGLLGGGGLLPLLLGAADFRLLL